MNKPRLIPVDFSLRNPTNNEGVLFTLGQGTEGQQLDLEIWNNSLGDIFTKPDKGLISNTNYHFALCCPPGLLLEPEKLKINVPDAFDGGWSSHYEREEHGFDCYYLYWNGRTFTLPKEHDQGALQFHLNNLFIDTKLAWRHTTVVLRSRGFKSGAIVLPESTRRIPLTVLHTFAKDLSGLENVGDLQGIKAEVIELRDALVPPLQARVVGGWNMLASGSNRSLQIEILPNPAFFQIHSDHSVIAPNREAQIRILPIKDTPSVDITAELPGNAAWAINGASSQKGMIIIQPKGQDRQLTNTETLKIGLTLNTGDLEIVNLELRCLGFKHGNDQAVEDFVLRIPLHIGPMEMAHAAGESTRIVAFGESADERADGILQIRSQFSGNSLNLRLGVKDHSRAPRTWIQSVGGFLTINAEGNDTILNLSKGNVGIGVPNPNSKLEVAGDTGITGQLTIGDVQTGTWPRSSSYVFWGSRLLKHGRTDTNGANNYALLQHRTSGNTYVNSPERLHFRIGNADKMIIDKMGNLTIGRTTAPTARLHVRGKSANENSGGILSIEANGTPNLRMGVINGSSGRSWIQSHGRLPLHINHVGNDTVLNRLGGQVSIGRQPEQNYKLSVSGVGSATEWRTNNIRLTNNRMYIGGTFIEESDLKILRKLARSQLQVKIKSSKGWVLDNYFQRVNDGDKDRTIQFQKDAGDWRDSWVMKIQIKP